MSEYAFEVYSIEHCPTSKEGWDKASARLECNSTHGYHCVPNKHLTSLIEFCYPRGTKLLFEEGLKTYVYPTQQVAEGVMFFTHLSVK